MKPIDHTSLEEASEKTPSPSRETNAVAKPSEGGGGAENTFADLPPEAPLADPAGLGAADDEAFAALEDPLDIDLEGESERLDGFDEGDALPCAAPFAGEEAAPEPRPQLADGSAAAESAVAADFDSALDFEDPLDVEAPPPPPPTAEPLVGDLEKDFAGCDDAPPPDEIVKSEDGSPQRPVAAPMVSEVASVPDFEGPDSGSPLEESEPEDGDLSAAETSETPGETTPDVGFVEDATESATLGDLPLADADPAPENSSAPVVPVAPVAAEPSPRKPTGSDPLQAALSDEGCAAAIKALADALEPGVVLWGPDGVCEMVSDDANDLLELDGFVLGPGVARDDFLDHISVLGALDEDQVAVVREKYREGVRFSTTRETASGRYILINVRPRAAGGHTATLNDITAFRENEAALAAAKTRAEKTERRLSAELARLNAEKSKVEERQEELQRLSLVAAHAKDLIVITDSSNRVIWVNEAFRRHNGLDLEMDLVGRSQRDVLAGPDTNPASLARIDEAVRNRQSAMVELICYKRSGDAYWMEQEIIPVFSEDGEHTNFIIVGRDISERKRAEVAEAEARNFEQSKRAESRLLSEFNEWLQSSDSLEEVFVVVSSFLAKLLPGSSGAVYTYGESREVLSRACFWGDQGVIEDFELSDCWALRRGRAYYYGENTVDIPCVHVQVAHGEKLPEKQYCLPIIAHGDTVGLMSVTVDPKSGADTQKLANFCAEHISLAIANVKLREQLREQSTRDPLTGLYNRRFFIDYARREIGRCRAQHRPAALISLDVDHFKRFNDTYGHDAGDLVLKSLAKVLKQLFRSADVPCRIGGEEFVVMMPGAGIERAMERAEQLRLAVETMEVIYNREKLNVTMSAGVAEYPLNGDSLEELMQVVDQALYDAKDAGRNCIKRVSDGDAGLSFVLGGGDESEAAYLDIQPED